MRGTHRTRPAHVHALLHAAGLGADHARRGGPVDEGDDEDDVAQRPAEQRSGHHHQRHVGDDQEVVGHTHQHGVGATTEITGDHTHHAADHHRHERRHHAHQQRHPSALEHQRQHVDTCVVGTERMIRARRLEDGPLRGSGGVRGQPLPEQRHHHEHEKDRRAELRGPTPAHGTPQTDTHGRLGCVAHRSTTRGSMRG